jgi:SAM-dependent methyltransferase
MEEKKDTYNSIYLKPKNDHDRYAEVFAKWVSELFNGKGKLCDYGCANGSFSIAFKKLGYEVVGVDIEDVYKGRFKENDIKFIKLQKDCDEIVPFKLPFKNQEFDYFFVKSTIEHLRNPLSFIHEVHRCLKKGGRIFLSAPEWKKWYKNYYTDSTHKTPVCKEGIKHAFIISGFKPILIRDFRGFPYIWRYVGTKAFNIKWFNSFEFVAIGEKK